MTWQVHPADDKYRDRARAAIQTGWLLFWTSVILLATPILEHVLQVVALPVNRTQSDDDDDDDNNAIVSND